VIELYEFSVLLAGLGLLTILVVRGRSIFVVAPLCALLTVMLSGGDPLRALTGAYMTGFADYLRRFYLIFALGAVFGKLMESSAAAATIANGIGRFLSPRRACLAVVMACAVLTYGGVSLFVVGFSVYPLAVQLFRAADLPRRFIPAAIAFGSITFTMTSAGSPEIQNLIPIQYLVDTVSGAPLTDARAGWPVSIIVAVVMFGLGQWYLERAIRRDVAAGGQWEERPGDPPAAGAHLTGPGADSRNGHDVDANEEGRASRESTPGPVTPPPRSNRPLPAVWAALAPLVVTLAMLNVVPAGCHWGAWWLSSSPDDPTSDRPAGAFASFLRDVPEDPTLAIFLGVLTALVTLRPHLRHTWQFVGDGFLNGLVAIGATASVVGFGASLKDLAAFQRIVEQVTHLPGDPLIGAALAVAIISAIAGSASGGQGIALPIIKPIYIDQLGVAPRALHRIVSISSGSLDSLPHNGYLVMLIRNICGETHARAYWPICVTTVLLPALGTGLAIALFKLVPAWAMM
jgi:H+/gluconate symporter-like permease